VPVSGFVVASSRSSSFSPFHSLRALIAPAGYKQIYGAYERPPFPIIIDTPTPRDIVGALRFSDFVMGATVYGTGIIWSYAISRPFPMLSQRLLVYHGISHLFFMVSVGLMINIPYRRLTGFWDNGLRWSKPEDKLRGGKYDNTSQFEKATIWGRLKPSKD
jgi:hypothetical protein